MRRLSFIARLGRKLAVRLLFALVLVSLLGFGVISALGGPASSALRVDPKAVHQLTNAREASRPALTMPGAAMPTSMLEYL